MKMDRKISSRVGTPWMALGGALVVLAGVLVAWSLSRAGDRVQVVQVAQQVAAGQALAAEDLAVTGIAFDAPVEGLVPAGALDELVGRVAAVDLQPGTLLLVGMWRDEVALETGEARVGVVLKPGWLPDGLGRGDRAFAAALSPTGTDPGAVPVRVLDATTQPDGAVSLTLAVPVADAVTVARLGASDLLVLVGVPPGGVVADAGVVGPPAPEPTASLPVDTVVTP